MRTIPLKRIGGTADVEYEISVDDIHENLQQIQVEVPLMFSLLTTNGLFFNIGPRFMLPVYTPYKQVITNGNIKVLYTDDYNSDQYVALEFLTPITLGFLSISLKRGIVRETPAS